MCAVMTIFLLFLLMGFANAEPINLSGEWSQFQKDGQMSAYQSLIGLINHTYMANSTGNGQPTLQPLVSDFNGFRKIIIVQNFSLFIYSSNFTLEKSIDLNDTIYSITTSDFDLDGNTEIILVKKELEDTSQEDNISIIINFRVYEYTASTLNLEKNFNISLPLFSANLYGSPEYRWGNINPKISNIICGQFIGANDCIFISPLNITERNIYAFNSSATSENDNLLLNLNISAYAEPLHDTTHSNSLWLYSSGRTFWTLDDLNGDGFNEINFVWANSFMSYPATFLFGRAMFFSIDKNSNFIRNVSLTVTNYTFIDTQDPSGTGGFGLKTEAIDNTITKLYNFNGINKYILVAINRRIASDQSSASFFGIYDNVGDIIGETGYDFGYNIQTAPDIVTICPYNLDFIPYNPIIYIYSNWVGQTIYGSARACGELQTAEQEILIPFFPFSPADKELFLNETPSFFKGNIKGITTNVYPLLDLITKSGIASLETPSTFSFNLLPFNDTEWSIPADINKDNYTEFIYINGTDFSIFNGSIPPIPPIPPTNNSLPYLFLHLNQLSQPYGCVKVNVPLIIEPQAYDLENDTIYYAYRCFEGDNLSAFTTNKTAICTYSVFGDYNISISVNDTAGNGIDYRTAYYPKLITVSDEECTCGYSDNSLCFSYDIVNPRNINKGILPDIYYGMKGFLNHSFSPIYIILFCCFLVAFIVGLFALMGKLLSIGRR
jgi:hypothetical protein